MTKEQFLKLHSSYHGEVIDNIKQLVQQKFTGDELYDFCKFIVEQSSPAMVDDGWIDVKDRLPKFGKMVLAYFYPTSPIMEGEIIGVDSRINTKGTSLSGRILENIENQKGFSKNVTHWMPLPNPPKQ